jgi:hypothetical protein
MAEDIAVISGHKVEADSLTRWSVYCYVCKNSFGEVSLDPESLEETLEQHLVLHQ